MNSVIDRIRGTFPLVSEQDVDDLVKAFMLQFNDMINDSCKIAYGENNEVSRGSFKEVLKVEIRNATISFINNNRLPDQLPRYLIACVRSTADKLASVDKSKSNVSLCTGCTYLERYSILESRGKNFVCHNCENDLAKEDDPSRKSFFSAFALQSKKGFRCPDCSNFIPNPNEDFVSCPYMNCGFYGEASELEIMRRPVNKGTREYSVLDQDVNFNGSSHSTQTSLLKETGQTVGTAFDGSSSTSTDMAVQQTIQENYNILMDVIDSQLKNLHYHSNESTLIHKKNMYESFKKVINSLPTEMISYLVYCTRSSGIQHKIFQEYVELMEKSLPFSFIKNGKSFTINSLLDPTLCIFTGVNEFQSFVNDKNEINNETKERYVGGRKGFYDKAYYIGKLVDVFDEATGESLLKNVKSYSFFKVTMDGTIPVGTKVHVSVYSISPHYQMGSLVYLNRIRRKIVDAVYLKIHGVKRPLSR